MHAAFNIVELYGLLHRLYCQIDNWIMFTESGSSGCFLWEIKCKYLPRADNERDESSVSTISLNLPCAWTISTSPYIRQQANDQSQDSNDQSQDCNDQSQDCNDRSQDCNDRSQDCNDQNQIHELSLHTIFKCIFFLIKIIIKLVSTSITHFFFVLSHSLLQKVE